MQFALNYHGIRVNIAEAEKDKEYYCPCCHERMVQKKGRVMMWHYAHKALNNCVSYYDHKGEWHRKMQELFPERNREIFDKWADERHIYDVLTDKKRIIEFQHSPISIDEFRKRTSFYISASVRNKAKKPIWVFNLTERDFLYDRKRYENFPRRRRFYWKRSSRLFDEYTDYQSDAPYELWFYVQPYVNGGYIGENFGYPKYEKIKKGFGFVKVLSVHSGGCIIGDTYTEEQFYQYITRQ